MRRREFIRFIGGSALAWPCVVHAQQPNRPRRIGVLMQFAENDPEARTWIAAFRDELRKLGWTEGRNLQIEYRWATPDLTLIQRFAGELIALKPELIVSSSTPTTKLLLQQTRTIPIIFTNIVDPVGSGFVASLPRPGGNVTGFINLEASISGKLLQLLKEIAPHVSRVAIYYNPATAPYAEIYLIPFKAAAATLGVEPTVAPVKDIAELETVIAAHARKPNGGLIAMPDSFNNANRREITALAARYRLPAIYPFRAAQVGGLITYGNNIGDNYRRSAAYVDRILKGEKPSDLPVQFPVKFELAINLKTAKALGLDVPLFLQQRADEVIE